MDFKIFGFFLMILMFHFHFISCSPFSNRIAYHRAKLRQQHQRNQLPHMLRSRIGDGQETLYMLQNIPGKIPRYIKRNFRVTNGDHAKVEEEKATSKPIFQLNSYEDEYFTSTTMVAHTNAKTSLEMEPTSTATPETTSITTVRSQQDLWSPLLIQAVLNERYGTTTVEPVLPVVGADYTQVVPWSLLSPEIQHQLRRKGLVFAGYPIEYQSDLPPQNFLLGSNQFGTQLNDIAPKYNPYFIEQHAIIDPSQLKAGEPLFLPKPVSPFRYDQIHQWPLGRASSSKRQRSRNLVNRRPIRIGTTF